MLTTFFLTAPAAITGTTPVKRGSVLLLKYFRGPVDRDVQPPPPKHSYTLIEKYNHNCSPENARFYTFPLVRYRPWTDRQKNKVSFKVVSPRPEKSSSTCGKEFIVEDNFPKETYAGIGCNGL